MFHAFGKYELVLTAVALLGAGILLVNYPAKGYVLLVGVFVLAGGMVVAVALGLMPRMDSLIAEGRQQTPEFIKLHVKSMIAMTIQAGLLLLSGGIILGSLIPMREATARRGFEVEVEPQRM
jgi:hypothetical protein